MHDVKICLSLKGTKKDYSIQQLNLVHDIMTMTNQAPFGQLVVHGTYTAFGQLVVYGTYKSY